jgi:hypothetical protein
LNNTAEHHLQDIDKYLLTLAVLSRSCTRSAN